MLPVQIHAGANAHLWTGVADAAVPGVVFCALCWKSASVVFLFLPEAKQIESTIAAVDFFTGLNGDRGFDILPMPESSDRPEEDPQAFDLECDRLAVLSRLNHIRETDSAAPLLIVTTPRAFLQKVPKREQLAAREIVFRVGAELPFGSLPERLAGELGYSSEAVCERPGEFAVRGGLLDIYPVNADRPYRIDFFGDEVDSIRAFDPTSQRSGEEARQLSVTSLQTSSGDWREQFIFDYLPDDVLWLFHEPGKLAEAHVSLFEVPERMKSAKLTFGDLFEHREAFPDTYLGIKELDLEDKVFAKCAPQVSQLNSEPLDNYRTFVASGTFGADRLAAEQNARKDFLRQMLDWQKRGWSLYLVAHNEAEFSRFKEIAAESVDTAELAPHFLQGNIGAGFRLSLPEALPLDFLPGKLSDRGVVIVTDSEIFGRYRAHLSKRRRKLPNRKQVDQLLDFSELVDGDPLVHLQHGVCLFRGISEMDFGGRMEEVISLEFDDSITIHLPLHESHLLTRYVGLAKAKPKLGKPGTARWERTRRAAEQATLDLAAELLRVQAARELRPGKACGTDTHWQQEFEGSFRYTETKDQMGAIVASKNDLERKQPMDRLICGDVGFGKTEVALRAAFKMVMEGRQVAILAPTTILAQQHLNTFRERMADYPVAVEMLSRFRSPQEQKKILPQVASGAIDILVGTHRILSEDVVFKDLGLLVIDEEHRFGVKHKESIKRMRAEIDILTMSATPIPRTLYMALMGARDLSVIETPPVDRLPIETIVKTYDLELVKRAVRYETDRGGQVFYLHNRVKTIESVADRLREQMPNLRIGVGHGQMDEEELEDIMTRFVAGEFDVLVCTTIIENGLDIPNCNTIIIEGADRFGLSQLYQLRGRVGRFKRQAYCYLLLHRAGQVHGLAGKRLATMRQHNQLGSGYRIAMRDLELRGAGNLLGAQQSGHIAGVGFEMYCSLLRQSVSRLKGDPDASLIRASVRLDFVQLGEGEEDETDRSVHNGFEALKAVDRDGKIVEVLNASIPHHYIGETRLRIDFYRKLAMAEKPAIVDELEAEIVDRFGEPPPPTKVLLTLTRIRTWAEKKRIQSVETEGDKLKLKRASGKPNDFIKTGSRFPRLTAKKPEKRLSEVLKYLRSRV